jgi:surface antigen
METITQTYGSNAEEVIALNDLEVSGISEGMNLVIRNGSLPETERPEYVAPVRRSYRSSSSSSSYTYTYLGDSATRTNLTCNARLGGGQCTTWGWLKRPDLGFIKANANRWDDIARAAGLTVNHTPAAGAIFQTDAGWYGHVGYVESVNSDGSINISERNYAGCRGGVLFSTVPASAAGRFNYIH